MNEEVKACFIQKLIDAKTPRDIVKNWLPFKEDLKNSYLMILLDSHSVEWYPLNLRESISNPEVGLMPYFKTENIFFFNNKILNDSTKNHKKEASINPDYSLMFDTNFASNIYNFINDNNVNDSRFYHAIDTLLKNEFQYDYLFYFIENFEKTFKLTSNLIETEAFQSMYMNIVALEMFKSIDSEKYKNNGSIEYKISQAEAFILTDDLLNSICKNEKFHQEAKYFNNFHKNLVLFLIGVLEIEFSSKKSARKKIEMLIDFQNEETGTLLEREIILAYKYFENRKNVAILNKISPGMLKKNLIKKIFNIAWDLMIPRVMEISLDFHYCDKSFYIPFVLTLDNDLKKTLNLFDIKGILKNNNTGELLPIPTIDFITFMESIGSNYNFERLLSVKEKANRQSIRKRNLNDNFNIINCKLETLCILLKCK